MRTIFGLVGQSGAGKTTLIEEIVRRLPDRIAIVKSLTTRPRRGPEDDTFYDFIPVEEMRQRETEGRLAQISEYAGNLYANDRQQLDELLDKKFGINALVEDGVNNLRRAGYSVTVIKVLPVHHISQVDKQYLIPLERREADKRRSQINLPADFILNNSFEPGGKEKAIQQLAKYIHGFAR
jgi:guanylate kinase